MTKLKSKAGKEFNTEWIIDWEYWVFFFLRLIKFLKALTDLEFLYCNCKIIPFIYAIQEKSIFKGFCSWRRRFNNKGWSDTDLKG